MGEVQTLEQFREWIRSQCRKDVDPQFGDNMVAEFEKIIRADTIPREAVQAAVDLMQAQIERPLVTENRQWNLGRMDGIECGKRSVFRFTGITPKED